ncbi:hypothetical protein, partial [Stenotrophomonas maltophilia group sp. RNC7]|uniref:hypothetical protein n=1 Tax=Stenotrophomonas maltophilia group sp. RNC7 TaxID=3071467 RepID=UPI0027E1BF6A
MVRQIGEVGVEFVPIPDNAPIDPLSSGHPPVLYKLIEFCCAYADISCGFLTVQSAWWIGKSIALTHFLVARLIRISSILRSKSEVSTNSALVREFGKTNRSTALLRRFLKSSMSAGSYRRVSLADPLPIFMYRISPD